MAAAKSIFPIGLATTGDIFDREGSLFLVHESPAILIVDGVAINRKVIRATLRAFPYRIFEAEGPAHAFSILQKERVDLLIVDMVLPELSGPDFCRRVKADRRTHLIPILILTSIQGVESEVAGIASGADEFLLKPLHPEVVRTRIRSMLRHKSAIDSLDEAETILFALARAVEQRDKGTGDHCGRLSKYAVAMGEALGLGQVELQALRRGVYLHDIGKVCVPDAILFKPGRLDEEEWSVMCRHTIMGEEICRPMKSLAPVLPIIRSHHERWDGGGYPDGLAGEEIPLLARIMQTVDIYDALVSRRSYKAPLTHTEALDLLAKEVDKGWRDPRLVAVFREAVCEPVLDGPPVVQESEIVTPSLRNLAQQLSRQV
ncbi:MAG: HD domain-containing phosphohydrolase [Bryobacteraceae bacterium]